jgi:sugar lactone lactonase YvrE
VDSLHFVMGGRNGVTLNAPKGTAITGDTLWVTDLDAVRGFNRFTGAPLATIEFGRRARFLNDLALGPDGRLYVSEMGVATNDAGQMSPTGLDNVFRIGDGHRIESIMTRSKVPMPNGITSHGQGLLIGSFSEPEVREWREDAESLVTVGKASGTVDGIGVLDDGRIVASSWDDSTVAVVGATPEPLITGVAAPADFEIDRKRHRVLIPQLTENQVVIWQLR